ncbi:MAG: transketolase C-terminal domain-containing protein, partial [Planctomycetaceae bacterium]
LQQQGVSVEVIDPRTTSPLDIDTILQSVARTGRVLVIDEAFGPCSVASEIAAQIADRGFNDLDAPVRRINGAFTPTPYAATLEQAVVPNVNTIQAAITDLLQE